MRAVVQRVLKAKVTVDKKVINEIDPGIVALIGVGENDNEQDAVSLADKIINLRIFDDETGKMNLSLADVNGSALVISQFTLLGDARKGRRPNYSQAASGEKAQELYQKTVSHFKSRGINTKEGVFGAHMEIELINDGPVTILLDSKKHFKQQ